jgi:hypothetical protein
VESLKLTTKTNPPIFGPGNIAVYQASMEVDKRWVSGIGFNRRQALENLHVQLLGFNSINSSAVEFIEFCIRAELFERTYNQSE